MSTTNPLTLLKAETRYSGDRVISRILQCLGCEYEVATNPYVIEKVEKLLRNLYEKGKIKRIPSSATEEEIKRIAESIKPNSLFSRQEIAEMSGKKNEQEAGDTTFFKYYYGISVDPITDCLKIQQITFWNQRQRIQVETTEFQKGKYDSVSATSRTETKEGEAINEIKVTTIANRNGIVESKMFEKNEGKKVKIERTKGDPILAKITFLFETPNAKTAYMPMDIDALPNLMEKQIKFTGNEDGLEEKKPEEPKKVWGYIRTKHGDEIIKTIWGYATIEDGKKSSKYQGVNVVLQNMDTPVTNQEGMELSNYKKVLEKLEQESNAPISINMQMHFLAEELFGKRYAFGMRKLVEEYRGTKETDGRTGVGKD